MDMKLAILRLIKFEVENGTDHSLSTAYAMAIGIFHASNKAEWKHINSLIPNHRVNRVKEKAWEKYDAMVKKQ